MSLLNTLSTMTSSYSLTTCSLDGDGADELSTTYASSTTTTSSTNNLVNINNDVITIKLAEIYVESMTDEELMALTTKLDDKQLELDLSKEEPVVKVYKKI